MTLPKNDGKLLARSDPSAGFRTAGACWRCAMTQLSWWTQELRCATCPASRSEGDQQYFGHARRQARLFHYAVRPVEYWQVRVPHGASVRRRLRRWRCRMTTSGTRAAPARASVPGSGTAASSTVKRRFGPKKDCAPALPIVMTLGKVKPPPFCWRPSRYSMPAAVETLLVRRYRKSSVPYDAPRT
jgi:hypothetical protein